MQISIALAGKPFRHYSDAVMNLKPPQPLRPDLASQWMLRKDITFLNHGSFGAVPQKVFEAQEQWRQRIEQEPVELMDRRLEELLKPVKTSVGDWLGMEPADFGLVTNATEAVNAILRSLDFHPGDEILSTTHAYNAVRNTLKYISQRTNATYREVEIPMPVTSSEQITAAIRSALTGRTRLLVVDHVTSPTALVFPIEQIIAECRRRGIDILVDGAHGPGMLDLNIQQLSPAYYVGNLHKWACAPKGSAFVYVRPDHQNNIHPTIINRNLDQGFAKEFFWQGTRDYSAALTVPTALQFMGELGWDNIRRHNHVLAAWAHQMLCESWNVQPLSPIVGNMLGFMATIPLPLSLQNMSMDAAAAFQQDLYSTDRIEVPLIPLASRWHLRISCQVYNTPDQYERLAQIIRQRSDCGIVK